MQLAVVAAGYSPGEADRLRRAMAAGSATAAWSPHREKLIAGMLARGYEAGFAQRLFEQIAGFGEYGFPESHSASFALLASPAPAQVPTTSRPSPAPCSTASRWALQP